jgi:hypothetical protein
MVPLYYIAPRQSVIDHIDLFPFGCHMVWADEANGIVIVKVRFRDEDDHTTFMKQPGVEMLPHPVLEQEADVDDKHLDHADLAKHPDLKERRDNKKAGGAGVKMRHLIKAISKPSKPEHFPSATPLMDLTVL